MPVCMLCDQRPATFVSGIPLCWGHVERAIQPRRQDERTPSDLGGGPRPMMTQRLRQSRALRSGHVEL